MDTTLKYAWQQAVLDAFLELQPERLPEKINVAERTIRQRLHNLQPDSDERAALHDALNLLHVVFSLPEAEDRASSFHEKSASWKAAPRGRMQ